MTRVLQWDEPGRGGTGGWCGAGGKCAQEEGGRGEVRDPRRGVQGEGWAIFRGGAGQPQVRRRGFPRC